jgi:predicted RecB family nuclease
MRKIKESFQLTATDLVGFLNCQHLAMLDRAVAEGALARPKIWDPLLDVLSQRGALHEESYVAHLSGTGLTPTHIAGVEVSDQAVTQTLEAMRRGDSIIVQAALSVEGWSGRADILRRVEAPSALGGWSYEPVDTKLARETKAGTIIQLCLYAQMLSHMQGSPPEYMHVIAPWADFKPQTYRFADFAAYFRKVRRSVHDAVTAASPQDEYPVPIEHCDICRWRQACDQRRHSDDHVCLVAGVTKMQIGELKTRGIDTVKLLGSMPLPLAFRPERGSMESYVRIREQARIVVEARTAQAPRIELLPVVPGFGLTKLPEPSPGDVFLDLEGDPFAGEHGLEYLFGHVYLNGDDQAYIGAWALSREDEKRAFEQFIDFVMIRRLEHPGLHVYHYAAYEPGALKRLMGRYATREEEVDQLLRGGIFVDLYQVVRHALRASVESYSIKRLEPFIDFKRAMPLEKANLALATLEASLELNSVPSAAEETKATVQAYNEDDCRSAHALREWLEAQRATLLAQGLEVPRPTLKETAANEKVTAWLAKINELIAKLNVDIPADRFERTPEQQARWILANILDWHRREEKAVWWEYFRLADLSAEDLLEEKTGISGLSFLGAVGGTAKAPVHRYGFPPQETQLRGEESLRYVGGERLGTVDAISIADRTIDIKKRQDTSRLHPPAIFAHDHIPTQVMADALVRIAEHVIEHGMLGSGAFQAARDLLLREGPRVGGVPLQAQGESTVAAAVRLCGHLIGGILPIQGPPGAGKTFTGAQMICELVVKGKKVGITANGHTVIRNLIDETIRTADQLGIELECCQKPDEMEHSQHRLTFAKSSEGLIAALMGEVSVGGGTAWHWSRPDVFETVDVLFVDEAAQMSLANVLAVSQAAKAVVLIGDPQQLDQPMKGTHPEGTGVSALNHVLGDEHTIPADKGLFLEETWRLHPSICAYTSELFYDGKLRSRQGLDCQRIKGFAPLEQPGLYFLGVEHSGNQNNAPEEAQAIASLVQSILGSKASWIDRDGKERNLSIDDIVIITPYNAQVFEIELHLPGARVGTVDKFQGQQAPIAIYSTATSTHADAPRGMEFLYSLNRLNVATSRAKCVSLLVSAPKLFDAECRTPRQIQLANAFCRYLEVARRYES